MMDCSDLRFGQLVHQGEAILSVKAATIRFIEDNELTVRVVRNVEDIPAVPLDSEFKYSKGTSGSLDDARYWMEEGHSVWVVFVEGEGAILGYGIALKQISEGVTEVKIIDVDRHRRRSQGLYTELDLEGARFQVGVAHVLILELMTHLQGPVETDATSPASRYAFKSLGFVHDEGTSNPCILVFE